MTIYTVQRIGYGEDALYGKYDGCFDLPASGDLHPSIDMISRLPQIQF